MLALPALWYGSLSMVLGVIPLTTPEERGRGWARLVGSSGATASPACHAADDARAARAGAGRASSGPSGATASPRVPRKEIVIPGSPA